MPKDDRDRDRLAEENAALRAQIEEREQAELQGVLSRLEDGQAVLQSSMVDLRSHITGEFLEVNGRIDQLDDRFGARVGSLEAREHERKIREDERARVAAEAPSPGPPVDLQKMIVGAAGGGGGAGVVLMVFYYLGKLFGWWS